MVHNLSCATNPLSRDCVFFTLDYAWGVSGKREVCVLMLSVITGDLIWKALKPCCKYLNPFFIQTCVWSGPEVAPALPRTIQSAAGRTNCAWNKRRKVTWRDGGMCTCSLTLLLPGPSRSPYSLILLLSRPSRSPKRSLGVFWNTWMKHRG